MSATKAKAAESQDQLMDCFIIMPIADQPGYDQGHFRKVYDDIIKEACAEAGCRPVRADDVKNTNLIHLDILQKLIDSPIAICDLSSRNPNVLFELGLRQAFDKPTVLIKDDVTIDIFDIAPLRYCNYRKSLLYREVLHDQKQIAIALKETIEASAKGEGVNSIVKLLSLAKPAELTEVSKGDTNAMLQVIMAELNSIKSEMRRNAGANAITRPTALFNLDSSKSLKKHFAELCKTFLIDCHDEMISERNLRHQHSKIMDTYRLLENSLQTKDEMQQMESILEDVLTSYAERGL